CGARLNKNNNMKFLYIVAVLSAIVGVSCREKDYLEALPDSSIQQIDNYDKAQSLLDYTSVMRETPALSEISADDYFLPADPSSQADPIEYNAYLWKDDIFQSKPLNGDWYLPYQQVYYANSVLAALPKLTANSS